MTRAKKYVAAAAITPPVVGLPTMAHALTPSKTTAVAASASALKLAPSVRVVALGERVAVAPKVHLWLSRGGVHVSSPDLADQFSKVSEAVPGTKETSVTLSYNELK